MSSIHSPLPQDISLVPTLPSFDILDSSFRQLWIRLAPSIIVLSLPYLWKTFTFLLPRRISHYIIEIPSSFLLPFLTLDELYPSSKEDEQKPKGMSLWKGIILVGGSLVHALGWTMVVGWDLVADGSGFSTFDLTSIFLALLWVYSSILLLIQPRQTPHPTLVIFTLIQLVANLATFASVLFKLSLLPPGIPHEPLLSWTALAFEAFALVLELIMIGVSFSLKLQDVPEEFLRENKKITDQGEMGSSLEDMTSLWVSPPRPSLLLLFGLVLTSIAHSPTSRDGSLSSGSTL